MNINDEIQALEDRIKSLKKLQSDERQAKKDSVKPVYRFTLAPTNHWKDVYHDSVSFVRLEGIIVNRDEMLEAGYSERDLMEGGMNYVVNPLSRRIILDSGGGTVWVGIGSWAREEGEQESALRTFERLSKFLENNPEGGDVTDIVNEHRTKYRA